MSSFFSGRRPAFILSVAMFVSSLALIAGCPSNDPTDVVSGTVTVDDGQNVGGKVVFVGSDGKSLFGPILNGKYKLEKAPKGKYKIYLESSGLPAAGKDGPPKGIKDAPKDGDKMPKGVDMGVAAPEKYLKVETSGLEYEVKGGKEEHNLKLTSK